MSAPPRKRRSLPPSPPPLRDDAAWARQARELCGACVDVNAFLARALSEPNRDSLARTTALLGVRRVVDLLRDALQIEEDGGMRVRDGSRRRTCGGSFFALLRERVSPDVYRACCARPRTAPRPLRDADDGAASQTRGEGDGDASTATESREDAQTVLGSPCSREEVEAAVSARDATPSAFEVGGGPADITEVTRLRTSATSAADVVARVVPEAVAEAAAAEFEAARTADMDGADIGATVAAHATPQGVHAASRRSYSAVVAVTADAATDDGAEPFVGAPNVAQLSAGANVHKVLRSLRKDGFVLERSGTHYFFARTLRCADGSVIRQGRTFPRSPSDVRSVMNFKADVARQDREAFAHGARWLVATQGG
jgi:hypothetical protein